MATWEYPGWLSVDEGQGKNLSCIINNIIWIFVNQNSITYISIIYIYMFICKLAL